jgi:signal transduction histidine kinase
VSEASDRRDRWAQTGRRLATAPRISVVAGALLGLAALVELAARTTVTSVVRFAPSAGAPTQSLRIGNVEAGLQAVVVVCLLALATTVPPAFLRPPAAAVAVCVANVLSLGLFHIVTVAGACALMIVLYRLGWTGSRLLAPSLALPFLVFALAGSNPTGSEAGVLTVLLASLAPAAAWAGLAQSARNEALVHSAAQEVIASSLLEHTARGERARIARELHDVVAHHISMIAVQAETARLATPGMPATGARRLLEIGDTARAALTEMRRLLGVLRDDARAAGPARQGPDLPGAERRPQPTLQQLNELLDEARSASGTGVRLIVSGSPVTLDPGVELAAYHIIQEALTNARRHAPGAAVDVELHYTAEVLWLRIRDNGPGPPSVAPVGGHGLLGMRERAAAVGGRLSTGPATVGGFVAEATLPAKAEAIT